MTREKKFFSPTLHSYNNNIEKVWRIEYLAPTHRGQGAIRKVVQSDINKFKTVEARIARANQVIAELNARFKKPEIKAVTVFERVSELQSMYWRPKTLSTYATVIKAFDDYFGRKDIDRLTNTDITKFLLQLHRTGKSTGTIDKYRSVLFALFAKAVEYRFLKENPVILVKRRKPSPRSLAFFTDAQIDLFKHDQEIPAQMWLAIKLLFYCFVRPGEMRNLKIGHINFEQGFIEVPSEFSKNGKTQKVSIPASFLGEIKYLQAFPNSFYILSKSGAPGQVQLAVNSLNLEHTKILDRLKIRGHYAFYSWKHTGAVKAVRAGIN